jgi:hypothetical protein
MLFHVNLSIITFLPTSEVGLLHLHNIDIACRSFPEISGARAAHIETCKFWKSTGRCGTRTRILVADGETSTPAWCPNQIFPIRFAQLGQRQTICRAELLSKQRGSAIFLQFSYTKRGQNAPLTHVAHHSGAEPICSLLL